MPSPRLAAEQKTFSRVISLVARGLKADGFVRRGQVFNRRVDSGVVHVLGFQKFVAAYAGRFCINFQIVVPEVYAATHLGHPVPEFVQPSIFFLGGRLHGDIWEHRKNSLSLPAEEVAKNAWRVYEAEAVPLFGECSTSQGVVDHFERNGVLRNGDNLVEEAYAYCLAAIGQRKRAKDVLQRLVDAAASDTHPPASYIERIVGAAKREFGIKLRV